MDLHAELLTLAQHDLDLGHKLQELSEMHGRLLAVTQKQALLIRTLHERVKALEDGVKE